MLKTINYDISIIGGGLVGIITALALFKKNPKFNIALIEKIELPNKFQNNFDNRSIALSYPSICMLKNLNLWNSIKDLATPIKDISVSEKGHFNQASLSSNDENLDMFGAVIEMPHILEQTLIALKKTTIKILSPYTVENIINNENYYSLNLNNEFNLKSKIILACDGANSFIREKLQAPTKIIDYKQTAITFNIELKYNHKNKAYERFLQDGVIAALPLQKNKSACVLVIPSEKKEEFINLSNYDFHKKAQKIFGYRLGKWLKIGKLNYFDLSLIYAKKQNFKNILLFGNAAHFLHPVSGQGFNLSMRDIGFLYDNLNDLSNLEDIPKILDIYCQSRKKDQELTILATNSFINIFNSEFLSVTILRGISLKILEVTPKLKKLFSNLMMGKIYGLPKLSQKKI